MLGGKISNQDEDEVEQELEDLEKQVRGPEQEGLPVMPGVPNKDLPEHESTELDTEQPSAQTNQGARQAMLA